ncbi:glycerol-3-phosphate acyltransferase [Sporosarcina sp. CAU 1771]
MLVWLGAILIGGYFVGCVHGSVLAQKISGVNMKESGTKNAGASNVAIVLGLKFGALVAAIDISKGALAIMITRLLIKPVGFSEDVIWLLLFSVAGAIMIGHIFPFYMKFNGGKGTASLIGILLALDWKIGLIALAIFILVSIVTDFLIFGILMLYLSLIMVAIWIATGLWPLIIAITLFIIAILKHIENVRNLRAGNEKRVSSVIRKKN